MENGATCISLIIRAEQTMTRLLYAVISLSLAVGVVSMQSAQAQSIWFSPWGLSTDYMALFEEDAPWQKAASSIQAFEISDEMTYKWHDGDLTKIFADLQRRNIDLVVGIQPLTGQGPGRCGYHVEGYGTETGPGGDARHISSLGAAPRYYVMDEPLYFGHFFDREGENFGCRLPIAEVAREVGEKFKLVRAVYPQVRFGDVEPLMGFKDSWLPDLETWFDAYESATGDKLAFFRVDMSWDLNWRERIPALTRLLRKKGIPLQVIYNGNDNLKSDKAWIDSAVANFKAYEAEGRAPPDVAVIQYWTLHPSHLLPETDPRTATWLINRYNEWRQLRR
jgi:hypothetical protein